MTPALRHIVCATTLAFAPAVAHADPLDFPLNAALALGAFAHADAESFGGELEALFPDLWIEPAPQPSRQDDPFLWSIGGTFGGPGASPVPGAIFGCARYGLATRELFSVHGFAHPRTFSLMGEVLPLSDDAEVWPEAAVARLHCIFIWDDSETVRIIPEPTARRALSIAFEEVTTDADGALFAPLLGPDGFRLFGQNGPGDSVVWVESGDVILTNGHQQVSFRAFLIGGAV